MYTKEEIRTQSATVEFNKSRGKRVYTEGEAVDNTIENLEKLRVDLFVKGTPNTVFKYTVITDDVTGKEVKLSINVRPSNDYKLKGVNSSSTITLEINADIYNNFITQYAKWVERYLRSAKLAHNVNKMEKDLKEIISSEGIELDFDFGFELGHNLVDISDKNVIIGITPKVAENLASNLLYDAIELRRNAYRGRVVDFFKEVTNIMDIFRLDSQLTRDLEIRNRKSLYSMIRTFVTRRVEFLRTGVGYYEKDNTFAIVERVAIKEEDVETYEGLGYLVQDNTKPSIREKEANRTKIASRFKLSPFAKADSEEVETIDLTSILVN